MTVTDEQQARPYPPRQHEMATMVFAGRVFYSRDTGRWYEGAEGQLQIAGERGRLLRALRRDGAVQVDPASMPDHRRARRMQLTVAGLARLRTGNT